MHLIWFRISDPNLILYALLLNCSKLPWFAVFVKLRERPVLHSGILSKLADFLCLKDPRQRYTAIASQIPWSYDPTWADNMPKSVWNFLAVWHCLTSFSPGEMHGFWVVEHSVRSVGCADLNFETRRFWLRGQDLYKLSVDFQCSLAKPWTFQFDVLLIF